MQQAPAAAAKSNTWDWGGLLGDVCVLELNQGTSSVCVVQCARLMQDEDHQVESMRS